MMSSEQDQKTLIFNQKLREIYHKQDELFKNSFCECKFVSEFQVFFVNGLLKEIEKPYRIDIAQEIFDEVLKSFKVVFFLQKNKTYINCDY